METLLVYPDGKHMATGSVRRKESKRAERRRAEPQGDGKMLHRWLEEAKGPGPARAGGLRELKGQGMEAAVEAAERGGEGAAAARSSRSLTCCREAGRRASPRGTYSAKPGLTVTARLTSALGTVAGDRPPPSQYSGLNPASPVLPLPQTT